MDQQDTISGKELSSLAFYHLGEISITDLGKWLETKTGNKYTTVEREFIIEVLIALEQINLETKRITNGFRESWVKKSGTLQRVLYETKT